MPSMYIGACAPKRNILRMKRDCARALWRGLSLLLALLAWVTFGIGPAHSQSQPAADDTAQVKAHLKEILSQPEFQPEQTNGLMAQFGRAVRERWDQIAHWFQERWKALQKFLERFFKFAGPAGAPIGSAVSYVFTIVVTAAGIALVAWLIALIIRHFWLNRRDRTTRERTAFDESEGDDTIVTEPEAWLQQARKFADTEDFRRAFRCVFMAILLLLDQGGLIEFDRSRTNGDYLRLLRRQGLNRLLDAFRPLVYEFDRRWYRQDETGEADYRSILSEFERIRALMTTEIPDITAGAARVAPGKA